MGGLMNWWESKDTRRNNRHGYIRGRGKKQGGAGTYLVPVTKMQKDVKRKQTETHVDRVK